MDKFLALHILGVDNKIVAYFVIRRDQITPRWGSTLYSTSTGRCPHSTSKFQHLTVSRSYEGHVNFRAHFRFYITVVE